MFPLWAHAYSHRMMTHYECNGRTYNFDISKDIKVYQGDTSCFVKNGQVITRRAYAELIDCKIEKKTLETTKFNEKFKIEKNDDTYTYLYKSETDDSADFKKIDRDNWFKLFIGTEDEDTDDEVEPESDIHIRCIDTEDFQRPYKYYHKDKDKVVAITSESEGAFILSKDRSSAFVVQLLDEEDFENNKTNFYDIPDKEETDRVWRVNEDKITYFGAKPDCLSSEYKQVEDKFQKDMNDFKNFKPDPWQLHSLRYAGDKILLGHRPGFGKTINSILLAERMRNSYKDDKPKIYIVAPNRKILLQWVETLVSLGIDTSYYIWSTYDHLKTSQGDLRYPNWEFIEDKNDFLNKKALLNSPVKKNSNGINGGLYCNITGKKIKTPPKMVTHRLHISAKQKIKIEIGGDKGWGLMEDRYFFYYEGDELKELYGYTNQDIGYADYEEHISNGGLTVHQYLEQEAECFEKFKQNMKDLFEKITGDKAGNRTVLQMKEELFEPNEERKLSYVYDGVLKLHLYRAPQNCILVCDEIHQFARPKDSIKKRVLYKYILGCKHTIMASATPLEATGSELEQLYLLSEMLRTKRDYWNDKPKGFDGRLYDGEFLPPWHPLRDSMPNENMYQLANRMRNKFSRYNTVQNIQDSIDLLYEDVPDDSNFKTDDTAVMNYYFGIKTLREKKWVLEKEKFAKKIYSIGDYSVKEGKKNKNKKYNHYRELTKTALQDVYMEQTLTRKKLFPDLKPAGEKGFIYVNLDQYRVYMKDVTPQYVYMNRMVSKTKGRVQDGFITLKDGETDIRNLEKKVLSNLTTGFYYLTDHPIIANYTSREDLVHVGNSSTRSRKILNLSSPFSDELKWLYVYPTKQSDDKYEKIPYIPDLLGSKVLKIITTIEDQVRNCKNVMVYHKNVEILRMVQRGLAMRGHVYANDLIKKSYKNDADPESTKQLNDHANEQASKRFVKMDDKYIKIQKEAYGYETEINDKYTDFDQLHRLYELSIELLQKCHYGFFYLDYETKLINSKISKSDKCNNLVEFAKVAEPFFDENPISKNLETLVKGIYLFDKMKSKPDFDEIRRMKVCIQLMVNMVNTSRSNVEKILYDYCVGIYKSTYAKHHRIKNKSLKEAFEEIYYQPDQDFEFEIVKYYVSRAWNSKPTYLWKGPLKHKEKTEDKYKKYANSHQPEHTKDPFYMKIVGLDLPNLKEKESNVYEDDFFKLNIEDHNKKHKEYKKNMGKYKRLKGKNRKQSDIYKKYENAYQILKGTTKAKLEDIVKYLQEETSKKAIKSLRKGDNSLTSKNWNVFLEEKEKDRRKQFKDELIEEYVRRLKQRLEKDEKKIKKIQKTKKLMDKKQLEINETLKEMEALKEELDNSKYKEKITYEYLIKQSGFTLKQIDISFTDIVKFPSIIQSNQDVYRFCLWTILYMKAKFTSYFKNEKNVLHLTLKKNKTIDDYYDAVQQLKWTPLLKDYKSSVSIGESKMKKDNFLHIIEPRITGMTKKDRLYYALLEGNVKEEGENLKKAFEKGQIDCILTSGSGITGIDYKSCSPSFMICVDPESSPGKQDQFNGRTVRKNSHKNLPDDMKQVEYVSFVTKGIDNIKNYEVIETEDKSLRQLLKEKKYEKYREQKRTNFANKQRDKILRDIEDILMDGDVSVSWDKLYDLKKRLYFYELIDKKRLYAKENMDGFKDYKIVDSYAKKAEMNEVVRRQRHISMPTNEDIRNEIEAQLKEETNTEQAVRIAFVRAETLFEQGKGTLEDIIRLRKKLKKYGYKIETNITEETQKKRNIYITGKYKYPWEENNEETSEGQVDEHLKPWDTYFENYVNISHIPVHNNHAFLCVKHYQDFQKKDEIKDTYFCFACNQYTNTDETCPNCGFKHKDDNGNFLYYHLHPIDGLTKETKEMYDVKNYDSYNQKAQKRSIDNRIKRDRLELALTLNSIEHQVRISGDKSYKFVVPLKKGELKNKLSFYKRIQNDEIPEVEGRWDELMEGNKYSEIQKLYEKREMDRDTYEAEFEPESDSDSDSEPEWNKTPINYEESSGSEDSVDSGSDYKGSSSSDEDSSSDSASEDYDEEDMEFIIEDEY